jgi:aminopeptidase N
LQAAAVSGDLYQLFASLLCGLLILCHLPLQAKFVLKLTVPSEPYKVLSNMPLSHTHEHEDEDHHDSSGNSSHAVGSSHHDEEDSSGSTAAADESLLQTEEGHQKVDLVTYHFDPTPPMSSYLLAWVIGDLVSYKVECATMEGSKPVAVWGTNDRWAAWGFQTLLVCGC